MATITSLSSSLLTSWRAVAQVVCYGALWRVSPLASRPSFSLAAKPWPPGWASLACRERRSSACVSQNRMRAATSLASVALQRRIHPGDTMSSMARRSGSPMACLPTTSPSLCAPAARGWAASACCCWRRGCQASSASRWTAWVCGPPGQRTSRLRTSRCQWRTSSARRTRASSASCTTSTTSGGASLCRPTASHGCAWRMPSGLP
mmetsp:Transcript_8880/g.25594  ORF Transcript_8880/g.25594 Transcript_8880/m.25594 type:complete len:206 (+) Transcript_8880:602-1219(+)